MPGVGGVGFQFPNCTIELKLASSQILQFGDSLVVSREMEELHEEKEHHAIETPQVLR